MTASTVRSALCPWLDVGSSLSVMISYAQNAARISDSRFRVKDKNLRLTDYKYLYKYKYKYKAQATITILAKIFNIATNVRWF